MSEFDLHKFSRFQWTANGIHSVERLEFPF